MPVLKKSSKYSGLNSQSLKYMLGDKTIDAERVRSSGGRSRVEKIMLATGKTNMEGKNE